MLAGEAGARLTGAGGGSWQECLDVDAVLFGVLPCLIVWVGRYRNKMEGPYEVAGGKPLLIAVLIFSLAVMTYRITGMFT